MPRPVTWPGKLAGNVSDGQRYRPLAEHDSNAFGVRPMPLVEADTVWLFTARFHWYARAKAVCSSYGAISTKALAMRCEKALTPGKPKAARLLPYADAPMGNMRQTPGELCIAMPNCF